MLQNVYSLNWQPLSLFTAGWKRWLFDTFDKYSQSHVSAQVSDEYLFSAMHNNASTSNDMQVTTIYRCECVNHFIVCF